METRDPGTQGLAVSALGPGCVDLSGSDVAADGFLALLQWTS
ncbi:MAG: hypothetical protein OEW88_05675 [Gammaproteobacteria bacterium]|nr:hypothetical protein [Gammaproteobacteria bacterium]